MARKKILLTGAGFTNNFGAPLAAGLWSKIFNNGNLSSEIRRKMLRENYEYSYELLYEEFLSEGNKDSPYIYAVWYIIRTIQHGVKIFIVR